MLILKLEDNISGLGSKGTIVVAKRSVIPKKNDFALFKLPGEQWLIQPFTGQPDAVATVMEVS